MSWRQKLSAPAKESHVTVALCISTLMMSLMLWMIVWQSGVIAQQRDVIRMMQGLVGG